MTLPEPWHSKVITAGDDRAGLDQVLIAYFRQRPDPPAQPDLGIKEGSRTIRRYLAGDFQLGRNKAIPFTLPLDWSPDSGGENYLCELHKLQFLTNFINEYQRTGEQRYLDVAENVLLDWIDRNQYRKPESDRAWFEGSVSKRLLVLNNLLNEYVQFEGRRRLPIIMLLALIWQHGAYLERSKTYQTNCNHGIMQDMALMSTAAVFPEFKDASRWSSIALNRLRTQQVEPGFSTEGVWREHSPGYHFYTMNMFLDARQMLAACFPKSQIEFLDRLQQQSQAYLAHVLTPLGRFPPIGDSFEDQFRLDDAATPALQYTVSGGRSGTPAAELDGHFPDAGEATFRSSWGDWSSLSNKPADAFYVHIHAALNRGFGHRHADELSFLLHGLGRWWIIEAAKWGYDRGETRSFITSAQAHNSVTWNGAGMLAEDYKDPAKRVWMDPTFVSTPQIAAARAHNTRYPSGSGEQVKVTRTFVFLRDRQTLILIDRHRSPVACEWQALLYLPPDMDATLEALNTIGRVATHPKQSLQVVQEIEKTASVQIIKGQRKPMLGWYSPEFLIIKPTPVIVANRRGQNLVAATLIRIADESSIVPANLRSSEDGGTIHVAWHEEEGASIQFDVSAEGTLTVQSQG